MVTLDASVCDGNLVRGSKHMAFLYIAHEQCLNGNKSIRAVFENHLLIVKDMVVLISQTVSM
jgi:hypothetical protein